MNTTINMTGNWKPKLMIIGTLLGAGVGLVTASLLARAAEEGGDLELNGGDLLKTALGVVTTMRSVAALGAGIG
ncbi:MAG TPA: hypothetical protein ENJ56_05290 [Anaerolineae bacterium]|nr:hypothetical protein [Anaerolineae bacterium]